MSLSIDVDLKYILKAYEISKLSHAKKRKVGCVIVKNNKIISNGCNGTPSKFSNICETLDDNGKFVTVPHIMHAEFNAICKLACSSKNCKNSTLYVTYAPCLYCANMIIAAKISRVVFWEIKHKIGINHLKSATNPKIDVVNFPETLIMRV